MVRTVRMSRLGLVLALFLWMIAVVVCDSEYADYMRGGYFANWLGKGKSDGRYDSKYVPENYEEGLCTHLFYAFANIGEKNGEYFIKAGDEEVDLGKGPDGEGGLYGRIVGLKKKQPGLKVLLSFLGAWLSGEERSGKIVREMLETADRRKGFIKSVVDFVREHGFDGFDFDYEPFVVPKGVDKEELGKTMGELMSEMREEFAVESKKEGKERLMLTAAVMCHPENEVFVSEKFHKSLDYVLLMTYDFSGDPNVTGANSPLRGAEAGSTSIESTLDRWIEKVGEKKVVLGIAFYGVGWKLAPGVEKEADRVTGLKAVGRAPKMYFSDEERIIYYYEVCDEIEKGGERRYDKATRTPFVLVEKEGEYLLYSYDDKESIGEKLEEVVNRNIGGAFTWLPSYDDFLGRYGGEVKKQTYPLQKQIKKQLEGPRRDF